MSTTNGVWWPGALHADAVAIRLKKICLHGSAEVRAYSRRKTFQLEVLRSEDVRVGLDLSACGL